MRRIPIRVLVKAEGCNSYRKHAEVTSASKTQMYGDVVASRRTHQFKVLQRKSQPIRRCCNGGPNLTSSGKGLFCP